MASRQLGPVSKLLSCLPQPISQFMSHMLHLVPSSCSVSNFHAPRYHLLSSSLSSGPVSQLLSHLPAAVPSPSTAPSPSSCFVSLARLPAPIALVTSPLTRLPVPVPSPPVRLPCPICSIPSPTPAPFPSFCLLSSGSSLSSGPISQLRKAVLPTRCYLPGFYYHTFNDACTRQICSCQKQDRDAERVLRSQLRVTAALFVAL